MSCVLTGAAIQIAIETERGERGRVSEGVRDCCRESLDKSDSSVPSSELLEVSKRLHGRKFFVNERRGVCFCAAKTCVCVCVSFEG